MDSILIVEIVGYFGIILLQVFWGIRGELTEQRFALFQVAPLSLILISVVLLNASPEFPFGFLMGSIGTLVFSIIGFPISRWIYRQVFPPK
jgi:hypothetical protein